MKRNHGYSVIEVLLAGTIFALAASGIAAAVIFSQRANQTSAAKERALTIAEEGMTAVRSIRDRDSVAFDNLADDSDMALQFTAGQWEFITTPQPTDDSVDGYTRRVGIADVSTENTQKQVTVTVTYPTNQSGGEGTVSLVEQLGNVYLESITGVTSQSQNYLLAADILGAVDDSVSPGSNDLPAVGEAGTFTSSNTNPAGTWNTINFQGSYGDPIVIGTTNTDDTQESALVFEVQNVTGTSAEMRLCQTPGVRDGCGNHTDKVAGYIVLDLDDLSGLSGVEAGKISTTRNINNGWTAVSYAGSFSTNPLVFTTVQNVPGGAPVEGRVQGTTTTGFQIAVCHSENDNSCDTGYPSTEVAWLAIEPGNNPFDQTLDQGTVSQSSDVWQTISFTETFSAAPVMVVENQTNNGGQNGEVNEARNITSTGANVRYCEMDIDRSLCDSHTGETVAWLAIPSGLITTDSSSGGAGALTEYRLGEAGTFTSTNGGWATITYDEYTNPVIIGTAQEESSDPALVFEVRNVTSTSAEVRLCDSDGVGVVGCGTSGTESGAYVVIDGFAASLVNGIEVGTFTQSGGFPNNTSIITMGENLGTPIMFGAVQNTGQGIGQVDSPVDVRFINASGDQFEAGLCFHDDTNENACETSYGSAQIGWIAVAPGINLFEQNSHIATVSEENSEWAPITFGTSFDDVPLVFVENQTNNGAENGEINEARNITQTGAEVRFCEMDANVCNAHAAEDIGWWAIPDGFLTIRQ